MDALSTADPLAHATRLHAGGPDVPEVWLAPVHAFFDADGQLLYADPENVMLHPEEDVARLADSIDAHGMMESITYNRLAGRLLSGHGRLHAAHRRGQHEVVVLVTDKDFVGQRAASIALNQRYGYFDSARLAQQLASLRQTTEDEGTLARLVGMAPVDLDSLLTAHRAGGFNPNGATGDQQQPDAGDPAKEQARRTLAERFIVPPFTVLDARQGYWQERKRAWIALGIRGEVGRAGNTYGEEGEAIPGGGTGPNSPYRSHGYSSRPRDVAIHSQAPLDAIMAQKHGKPEEGVNLGPHLMRYLEERDKQGQQLPASGGTSVFDPVLCEIAYRWFCPPGGHVLDPFAGEATKGIVATYLGFDYTGIELRPEQIAANMAQAHELHLAPHWIEGDSASLGTLLPDGAQYDLVFTSPPYYDLEQYSSRREDGSAMPTYEQFMAWYTDIFAAAAARLAPNRFLVVKVGEIRDRRTGAYRNFVGDNIALFRSLGLAYYNEAVLVTAVGSLPIRVSFQFPSSRKMGKTHQNILVFYKGDPRTIKDHFPQDIDYGDMPVLADDPDSASAGEGD